MFLIGFVGGSIVGIVFGFKVGKWAGQRGPKKEKPKPLSFDQLMLQAMQMPDGDVELAREVETSIEMQLREGL